MLAKAENYELMHGRLSHIERFGSEVLEACETIYDSQGLLVMEQTPDTEAELIMHQTLFSVSESGVLVKLIVCVGVPILCFHFRKKFLQLSNVLVINALL